MYITASGEASSDNARHDPNGEKRNEMCHSRPGGSLAEPNSSADGRIWLKKDTDHCQCPFSVPRPAVGLNYNLHDSAGGSPLHSFTASNVQSGSET